MPPVSSPKISFIVPTYNVEDYLAECIESILRQPIKKEIIIVNDGSTDNSLIIALEYMKKYPFIYVISSENKGLPAARNAGLRLAKGEYVIFIDSDDLLNGNIEFENILALAEQHHISVIKGSFIQYEHNNPSNRMEMNYLHPDLAPNSACISHLSKAFQLAYADDANPFIQAACWLIRRQWLLDKHLSFNEKLAYAEDTLFNVDLFMQDDYLMEVHCAFILYRVRENSLATSKPNLRKLDAIKFVIHDLKNRISQSKREYKTPLELAIVMLFIHLQEMLQNFEEDNICRGDFSMPEIHRILQKLKNGG